MNTGDLTLAGFFAGIIQSFILADEGVAHTTHYTVPKGQELIIKQISVTVSEGRSINVFLHSREGAEIVTVPFESDKVIKRFNAVSGQLQYISFGGLRFLEMTDIWFSGTGAGQSASITANYNFVQYAIGT